MLLPVGEDDLRSDVPPMIQTRGSRTCVSARACWRRALATLLAALVPALPATSAVANPKGGAVRGGSATIHGQGTGTVTIDQHSQEAVLSWDSFDIAPGETTRFRQPNSDAVALNRIFQGEASQILGSLQANGHVYLVNPHGILFGREARVNVHALIATTTLDGSDLAEGGFDPSARAAPGARILNEGRIESGTGGFVYLVAPHVENGRDGVIVSPEGEVRIEAGATVYLTDRPDGLGLAVEFTAPAGGEAVNLGEIMADGGLARMRAELVTQGGVVQADSLRERAGVVELVASGDLVLAAGSETRARGGDALGSGGGTVYAWADHSATMEPGAVVDVSAHAFGGDGGFAELSAAERVEVAGRFEAGAGRGGIEGEILIDPAELEITGAAHFGDAAHVVLEADEEIRVADGALLDLASTDEARVVAAQRTLSLRSGGDVVLGEGARIVDDGTGGERWSVELLAGGDLASEEMRLAEGADGDVVLARGSSVSLARGAIDVVAAGDVILDEGSSLRDTTGDIRVEAGGDVRFTASRTPFTETVIETGSGDVEVVAGGSVLLQPGFGAGGNAAIRTRGVPGVDADGNPTREDGGSILVWAKTGDVDAGLGNRWIEPGPSLQSGGPEDQAVGGALPDFDATPVVNAQNQGLNNSANQSDLDGVLGIGAEAGGSVVVIAGGDVMTRNGPLARSGGTASGLGTSYDGAHIGVFGVPVSYQQGGVLGYNGAVVLPGSPENALVVIAGGDITGDYMVRGGVATLLAGYQLPADVAQVGDLARLGLDDPAALDGSSELRADLEVSRAALDDRNVGWVGTLAHPITVDLVDGGADLLAYQGVALRAIENPGLVYPPSGSATGTAKAPSFGPDAFARIEAETGDVTLVGNDIELPDPGQSGNRLPNQLVRVLPPDVAIVTNQPEGGRAGDLVVLNDFTLFPSADGGLFVDVAGQVRTANGAASETATITLAVQTSGDAADLDFTIPGGARLLDPATGLVYTAGEIQLGQRTPAREGQFQVLFVAERGFEDQEVVIPAGTRAEDWEGRIYLTQSDTVIPAPEARFSAGEVRFVPEGGAAREIINIPMDTELVAPDGTIFLVTEGATLDVGDRAIRLPVQAANAFPGIDAPRGSLALVEPIPGIESATNRLATARRAEVPVRFFAEVAGATDLTSYGRLKTLLDPVPGAQLAYAERPNASGGADPGGAGQLLNEPTAVAPVVGPVGEIREPRALVLLDPQLLPPGVDPGDLTFTATGVQTFAPLVPVVLKEPGADGRPDASGNKITVLDPDSVWVRDRNTNVARIQQSDADPEYDARNNSRPFDYAAFYRVCRSGVACQSVADPLAEGQVSVPLQTGSGPTHAGDPTPAVLRAGAGFQRIEFDLAQPATLLAGVPIPGQEGDEDDAPSGPADVVDLALVTQHTRPTDETRVFVPFGNASFGGQAQTLLDEQTGLPATTVANPFSGVTVSGPGSLTIVVGVDEQGQATGAGGQLALSDVALGDSSARGIETTGNLVNTALPTGSAGITILAAGDVVMNDRGSIDTLQGGDITITSLGGSLVGGEPPETFTGKRGIFTMFVPPGAPDAAASGGGTISIDVAGDFDIGRSVTAALSGGNIILRSRSGSVSAGSAEPFETLGVTTSQTSSLPEVRYRGGGIFASSGAVQIVAEEDVDIGAGITGAAIAINAGGNVVAGQGSISSSGNVSISAGGSISGTITAGGSINVSGDVSQSANISAGGLVVGAGSVASNTGPGKVSAETSVATQAQSQLASRQAVGEARRRRGVIVEVTSSALDEDDEEDE